MDFNPSDPRLQTLLDRTREIGLGLAEHLPDYDLRPLFENLQVSAARNRNLLEMNRNGDLVLHSSHPLASKFNDGQPGRAYVLVTAMIALANRAHRALTDDHQRQLHALLLQKMTQQQLA